MSLIKMNNRPGEAPALKGQVMRYEHGIQTVKTDSKEHPVLHFMGFTHIRGAGVGDVVKCKYMIVPERNGAYWFGRKVG